MYVKLKSGRLVVSRVTAILVFSSFDLRETILVGPGAVARFAGKPNHFVFHRNSFLKK